MTRTPGRDIAIVGMACRFPGGVTTPRQFWQMLLDGVDAIGDLPPERIDLERYYSPQPKTAGKTIARRGGFLVGLDQFDAAFFGISPREAERMDPQHRLLLETAWEALEDAGLDPIRLEGGRTGVYVGQWLSDFEWRLFQDPANVDFPMTLGSGRYASSGRIAYALGLMGPSVTMDTACSSSLTAVHLAVQGLRSGETDLALAGGVNVILSPHIHIAYSQSGMMAPDGRCKFGDAAADGYVRSEGVGLFALKRLESALRDGDRIHAIIRGSAINNDGRGSGSIGRPSRAGQEALLRVACADASVAGAEIGYIEAHGTGTRAGDKVEVAAIAAALRPNGIEAKLPIGSVKTNIGHTEGAAGAAGLMKAVLVVNTGQIPPSLNCTTLNPDIDWSTPVEIAREGTRWNAKATRIAGVNSYGIAGANAHIIVEAPPERAPSPIQSAAPVLPLSARSEAALRALAFEVRQLLVADDALDLAALCLHAQHRRAHLSHRAAFPAVDRAALLAALEAYAAGGPAPAEGEVDPRATRPVAFICPGQGGQWAGMALAAPRAPAFSASLDACEISLAGGAAAVSWRTGAGLGDIDVVQPALGAMSIAYAAQLEAFGVRADAVAGHSMGEAAAARLAGVLSLEDALDVLARRSTLMRAERGRGAMALVDLDAATVEARLVSDTPNVGVAAINSPRACVISGDAALIEKWIETFTREGVFSRAVNVDVASHSSHMDEPARVLGVELAGLHASDGTTPFVSSVTGFLMPGVRLDGAYWALNLRQPVQFSAAVGTLLDRGIRILVELGPHPTLTPAITQVTRARGVDASVICVGRRDVSADVSIALALGQIWCSGGAVAWPGERAGAPHVEAFPLYPWRRERHWIDIAEIAAPNAAGQQVDIEPRLKALAHTVVWRAAPLASSGGVQPSRWLVVGEDEQLASALRKRSLHAEVCALDDLAARLQGQGEPPGVIAFAPFGAAAGYFPIALARALPQAAPIRLWLATQGAQSPNEAETVDVDHAAAWGAARVVGEEHADIWGGLIDFSAAPTAADYEVAAAVLAGAFEDNELAIRNGAAFAPRLVEAADTPGFALRLRTDASYLVTGGFGALGRRIGRALVKAGARHLILISRNAPPPRSAWRDVDADSAAGRQIALVREFEARGANVRWGRLDVSNDAALRALLDREVSDAHPPIRGVAHLAGAFDNRLARNLTAESFVAAAAGKLDGARHIDANLPDLDWLVMFSSLGALLPQAGQANYAAANAGLDALAHNRRRRDQHAISLGWGVWAGAGLVAAGAGAMNADDMARRGLAPLTPEDGEALFPWAAGRAAAHLVLASGDWAQYMRTRRLSLLADLAGTGGVGEVRTLDQAAIADIARKALSVTLKLPPVRIADNVEFGSLGLTSVLAMEFRNRLENALNRPLPATLAFNYPTLQSLSTHLTDEAGSPESKTGEPQAAVRVLTSVSALSDEEALAQLRGPRKGSRA